MRNFKRLITSMLVAIMTFMSVAAMPIVASAAEVEENPTMEYEAILEPGENIDFSDIVSTISSTSSTVNQTFNIGKYHRGADRSYSTSHLRFTIKITDVNGNATSNKVTVVLQDYNGNSSGWLISANGSTNTKSNISIVSGRVYYFTYTNSGSQTLRINMIITPY